MTDYKKSQELARFSRKHSVPMDEWTKKDKAWLVLATGDNRRQRRIKLPSDPSKTKKRISR